MGYKEYVDASKIGQLPMVSSKPVVIASNQSAIPVTSTPSTTVPVNNTNYFPSGDMSASINGPAITVGPEGEVEFSASWTQHSTQIGLFVLQSLSLVDGTTWEDIPGSSGGFGAHPNNDTARTGVCRFYGLRIFGTVRVRYVRTSGGSATNALIAGVRTL